MIEFIKAFSSYVPLFQTLVWVLLIVASLFVYRTQVRGIINVIHTRIEKGSHLKAGPIEIGGSLTSLEYIKQNVELPDLNNNGANGRTAEEWQTLRHTVYHNNRDVFLAHVITPSEVVGQKFDAFIYLVRHESQDFSDIEYAEFFFGKHWGNRVVVKHEKDDLIGVATSAPGPFLCTSRVTFKDGNKIDIYRYIDFEMSRVFDLDN